MTERTCLNCVYVRCDPGVWLRCLSRGEPLVPMCANHPKWPGELREVPGTPCRNYRPKPGTPEGDIKRIPLDGGLYALVDAADYEWLNRYKWHCNGSGYAARREKGKLILMHREIMPPPRGLVVDHVNRHKLDNCRSNLRVCTHADNLRNRPQKKGSSSRFRGVGRRKDRRRCYARLMFEGKQIWLGCFDDEVEAARAFDRKAVELGIVFARLNFPEEWPPERRQEVYAKYPDPAHKGKTARSGPKRAAAGVKTPARIGRKCAKPSKAQRAKSKEPKEP